MNKGLSKIFWLHDARRPAEPELRAERRSCARLTGRPGFFSHARIAAVLSLAGPLLGGCRGAQSALDPMGVQAEQLQDLWWLFFYLCAAVYLIVMVVLLIAFFRRKRASAATEPDILPDEGQEKRVGNVVKIAVGLTVLILFVFMVASFRTGRAIYAVPRGHEEPLSIKIVGHQWWWEIEYQDAIPSNSVTTANELRLPAGRPIKVQLESYDVIHSFWVPNLHGKKDLVPNYPTMFYFQADRPGTYWGQCAEFCGHQHAKMRFIVKVESPEEFAAWINAQRQPALPPTTDLQKRGQDVFLQTSCVMCHTINGTPAMGRVGPNLTHIASRPYIAAGSVPNTRGHLGGWILDPQKVKPGVRMPMNQYSSQDLEALLEYLQSLK